MEQSTAQRRLVKSPPELWAEVSSEDSLGRHLSEFGEIRITRVEPETTVAWEGDRASGTVELAPTGWGTKVILTVTPAGQPPPLPVAGEQPAQPTVEAGVVAAAPEPLTVPSPVQEAPAPRPGFFARLFRRHPRAPEPVAAVHDPGPPAPGPAPTPPDPDPAPTPVADVAPPKREPGRGEIKIDRAPQPPALDPARTAAILTEVLDDLGAAHHRPFSRG